MQQILLKTFRFVFISILFLSSTFARTSTVQAAQLPTGTDDMNSISSIAEESEKTAESPKNISMPDLGDDQAFPFIPGFGKNSGKD